MIESRSVVQNTHYQYQTDNSSPYTPISLSIPNQEHGEWWVWQTLQDSSPFASSSTWIYHEVALIGTVQIMSFNKYERRRTISMIQMQTSNIANEYKMSNGRCTFIWLDTYLHYKKTLLIKIMFGIIPSLIESKLLKHTFNSLNLFICIHFNVNILHVILWLNIFQFFITDCFNEAHILFKIKKLLDYCFKGTSITTNSK